MMQHELPPASQSGLSAGSDGEALDESPQFTEHVMECLVPNEHVDTAEQNLAQRRNLRWRLHMCVRSCASGQSSSGYRAVRGSFTLAPNKLAIDSTQLHVEVAVAGWSRSWQMSRALALRSAAALPCGGTSRSDSQLGLMWLTNGVDDVHGRSLCDFLLPCRVSAATHGNSLLW